MINKLVDLIKKNMNLIFIIYAGISVFYWLLSTIFGWTNISSGSSGKSIAYSIISPILSGLITIAFLGFGVYLILTKNEKLKKLYFVIFASYYLVVEFNRGFSNIANLVYISSNDCFYEYLTSIDYALMSLGFLAWAVMTVLVVFYNKENLVKYMTYILIGIFAVIAINYFGYFIHAIIEKYNWKSIVLHVFNLSSFVFIPLLLAIIPDYLPGRICEHNECCKEQNEIVEVEEDE